MYCHFARRNNRLRPEHGLQPARASGCRVEISLFAGRFVKVQQSLPIGDERDVRERRGAEVAGRQLVYVRSDVLIRTLPRLDEPPLFASESIERERVLEGLQMPMGRGAPRFAFFVQ